MRDQLNDCSISQATSEADKTIGIYSGALGCGYNTDLLAANNLPEPSCWKHLAKRNLRRSFLLQIVTGQAMAARAGLGPLSERQLLMDPQGERANLTAALQAEDGMLLKHTPLWFYVLKEAEIQESGNRLGVLGSRLVVEALIGLMRNSGQSILTQAWKPRNSELATGAQITTIDAFLRYAGEQEHSPEPQAEAFV